MNGIVSKTRNCLGYTVINCAITQIISCINKQGVSDFLNICDKLKQKMSGNMGDLKKDLIGGSLSIKGKRIIDSNRNLRGINDAKVNTFKSRGDATFNGDVTVDGTIIYTDVTQKKVDDFNNLRCMLPNEPDKLGSSTALQAKEYSDMPLQAGNAFSTGLKLEYDNNANKYALPSLDVTATFDLIPSTSEATAVGMEDQIIDAGFYSASTPSGWSRSLVGHWYGVTQDATNFYYSVWGGSLFGSFYGSGTTSVFVCRRKIDASLVWVKSAWNYRMDIPKEASFIGTPVNIARTALAIHKDRLYITTMFTNLGPQLFCIDKTTGDPIWTVAYDLPKQLSIDNSDATFLVASAAALGYDSTFSGTPYAGGSAGLGDLNINVVELEGGNPSVFVGVSSFQNALNAGTGFPIYTDQGKLVRIDDLGTTAIKVWNANTCAPAINVGDVISTTGPDALNPFRPGETTTMIWRETTSTGTFVAAGGVIGQVLDYTDTNPGYLPSGYGVNPTTVNGTQSLSTGPFVLAVDDTTGYDTSGTIYVVTTASSPQAVTYTGVTATTFTGCAAGGAFTTNDGSRVYSSILNNNTMPVVTFKILTYGDATYTESDVQNIFRSTGAGIGAGSRIYQSGITGAAGAATITARLVEWNTKLGTLTSGQTAKVNIWAYITQGEVTAADSAAWGATNSGVRYIAALPDNYTIVNDQEAASLGYYGNSVWGGAPCIDVKRNLVYFGSGQTHSGPVDDLLYFQNPAIRYYNRKQSVINTIYEYAHPDASTDSAPFATLNDVNTAKDTFAATTQALSLLTTSYSPRGNMSYNDAIIGANLTTGVIEFGYRAEPWDSTSFVGADPNNLVIQSAYLDGDISSGIMYFDNVKVSDQNYGTIIATQGKNSIMQVLDINGYDPNVTFDHTNLLAKGITPFTYYTGPDGNLGGSNYACAQDGGSRVITSIANIGSNFGTASYKYNSGYYAGYELHVTRDGRVLPTQDSVMVAFDVSEKRFVWESPWGQSTHSAVSCYNGIAFGDRGDGMMHGFDLETGEVIWKYPADAKHGISGINGLSFSAGQAVLISNYSLFFGGTKNKLGSTGILLNVDMDALVTSQDTLATMVNNKTFASFDIVPKEAGATVQSALQDLQTVTHVWSNAGVVTATHTYNNSTTLPPAVAPVTLTDLTFTATGFKYSSKEITFDDYANNGAVRYIKIKMMTRTKYVLHYQLLLSGVWTNFTACMEI